MSGPLAFIEAFSEERGAALDRADGATELLSGEEFLSQLEELGRRAA